VYDNDDDREGALGFGCGIFIIIGCLIALIQTGNYWWILAVVGCCLGMVLSTIPDNYKWARREKMGMVATVIFAALILSGIALGLYHCGEFLEDQDSYMGDPDEDFDTYIP